MSFSQTPLETPLESSKWLEHLNFSTSPAEFSSHKFHIDENRTHKKSLRRLHTLYMILS